MFNSIVACMLALSLSGPVAFSDDESRLGSLNAEQTQAVLEARRKSIALDWHVLNVDVAGQVRSVVLLGEVHLGKPRDIATGKEVIDQFRDIATENSNTNYDPEWDYKSLPVAAAIGAPFMIVYMLSTHTLPDSPMRHAKSGLRARSVRSVEQLHQPSVMEELSLLAMAGVSLVPVLAGGSIILFLIRVVGGFQFWRPLARLGRTSIILAGVAGAGIGFNLWADTPLVSGRDVSMAKYIDAWVKGPAGADEPLLVIVGKGHNPGLVKLLTEKYGFREQPIDTTKSSAKLLP